MTDQDSLNNIGVNSGVQFPVLAKIVYSLSLCSCFLSSGHWWIFPVSKTAEAWSRRSSVYWL